MAASAQGIRAGRAFVELFADDTKLIVIDYMQIGIREMVQQPFQLARAPDEIRTITAGTGSLIDEVRAHPGRHGFRPGRTLTGCANPFWHKYGN